MILLSDSAANLDPIDQILSAKRIVALTGAGISVESGIPTFRGEDGLWKNVRAEELATPEAFARDPIRVWEWYKWRREKISSTAPNPAHYALAELEQRIEEFTLITQNIDGFHSKAGSKNIIELHGNIWRARCLGGCGVSTLIDLKTIPPKCGCGAMLRPDVVWFGEPLDADVVNHAMRASSNSDVFLIIGTSAVVFPAAHLPVLAKERGAFVIEINPDATPLSEYCDIVIREKAGIALPKMISHLSSTR